MKNFKTPNEECPKAYCYNKKSKKTSNGPKIDHIKVTLAKIIMIIYLYASTTSNLFRPYLPWWDSNPIP